MLLILIFIYYPLKNIESEKDKFRDSYTYLFYEPFQESNLSIKPQFNETFRLTISGALGKSIVINITSDLLTVKEGCPGDIYTEDTSRLSSEEKFHLNILNARFPLNTSKLNSTERKYFDSLINLYPQLLKTIYYHKLYNKIIVRNNTPFTYSMKKIRLSEQQYKSLIKEINSSGFWTIPYKRECESPPFDGYGFILEANTKTKYGIVTSEGCREDTTALTKACQRT